jgi:hypothetical protein
MFQWNARLAGVIAVAVALAAVLGDGAWDWLSWGW